MSMLRKRWLAGLGLGAIVAAGIVVAPALQAQESASWRSVKRVATFPHEGLGSFTPAAADPKLAAVIGRTGLPQSGFRFTPSESRRAIGSIAAVSARVPATKVLAPTPRAAIQSPALGVQPIAYNLGVSVGWKRFSVTPDVAKVDLGVQPSGLDRSDLRIANTGRRSAATVADRPITSAPQLIGDNPSYSLDVGGSYSLTRNLDVTAGVRYKSDRQRLPQIEENRRDSQAVYVGTAFRF